MGSPYAVAAIWIGLAFASALVSTRTGIAVSLFLTTGMMGGYTTYSSFNYETLRLAEGGTLVLATLNVVLTVVGCLVSGLLGLLAARGLTRLGPLLGSGG